MNKTQRYRGTEPYSFIRKTLYLCISKPFQIAMCLFEQALGHLMERTTPSEELVARALRDVTLGVEAGSL